MHPGQMVLLAFGFFIILGGVMGYRAGSKVSLIAGATGGVLLIAAYVVAYSNLAMGLWLGAVIGLILSTISGIRLGKTRKFMPSGLLLAVSVLATLALIFLSKGTG